VRTVGDVLTAVALHLPVRAGASKPLA